jgi:hypothetical protein
VISNLNKVKLSRYTMQAPKGGDITPTHSWPRN